MTVAAMKRILVALLLLCVLPTTVAAQADAVTQGNEAFWKADYAAAAAAYRTASAAQPQNADLWYNLGTAEAQAKRYGHAMHAFEQSLVLRPGDADAQYNLEQTRSQIIESGLAGSGDARVVPPGDDDVGTGLLTAMTAQTTAIIFVITWAALFGLIVVWRRTRGAGMRTASSFIALIMGLLALASGGALLARALVLDNASEGIVLTRTATYSGPGKTYAKGPLLLSGVKLRLRGKEEQWRQVTLPDGSEGWIAEAQIGVLQRP